MSNCAFIDLGVMGYPMAGHLVAAGHAVTVYNRTLTRAETWVAEHGGTAATTPPARLQMRRSSSCASAMTPTFGRSPEAQAACSSR